MIGFANPYSFVTIPTGLIIPWASAASAPTGWSIFATAPNNYYIKGAGTSPVGAGAAGGTPSGHVRFDSTYAGAHLGTVHPSMTFDTAQPSWGAPPNDWRYQGGISSGSHPHTIDAIPTMGYNQYQLIQATTPMEKFPANSVLLNTLHYNIPSLTLTGSDGKYLRTGSTITSAETSILAAIDPSLSNGNHQHGWGPTWYNPLLIASPQEPTYYVFIGSSAATDGVAGWHVHNVINATITDKIKRVYMTAWTYATEFLGFQGMIGFWQSSTAPEGWSLCLLGNSKILLSDGTYKNIKEIVENKEQLEVLSFNEKTKKFEPNKIINWYKTPANKKEWLRLSIAKGKDEGERSITLTKNHPILTQRGWIKAEDVNKNDIVYRYEKTLTKEAEKVFYGMYLGDGSIEKKGRFVVGHGIKQEEYANYVADKLSLKLEYGIQKNGFGKGKAFCKYRFSTKTFSPNIYNLINRPKKVTKELLEKLGDIGLAYWFMDDGSLSKDKRYPEYFRANFHTEGFDDDEIDLIVNYFNSLNIKTRVYTKETNYKNKIRKCKMVCIDRDSNDIFFNKISKYIHPCLLYKIPKQYQCDFQEFVWVEKNLIPYDFIKREIVSYNTSKKDLKIFGYKYNIEVENNNTYIANNFIVHNCNGSNGTIDMTDHFVMITTNKSYRGTKTGTNVIDIAPSSGNMLDSNNFTTGTTGHIHYDSTPEYATEPATEPDNVWRSFYHTQYLVPHDHALTQGLSLPYYPQYYALYIIQKM